MMNAREQQGQAVPTDRTPFREKLLSGLATPIELQGNFAVALDHSAHERQQQTNEVFTDKWEKYSGSAEQEGLYRFQRNWFLELYGFRDEADLARFLANCDVVLDAGCGLGFKAAWFAKLSPRTLVIGMDFSAAVAQAAEKYADLPNLFFIQGDIANTVLREGVVDYVNCDQVIMHTEDPELTFAELARVCRPVTGQIGCYFYARKALPRELLDEHFRKACTTMSRQELWEMSEQLTELGRSLSDLKVEVQVPSIPALGIAGGTYDIQRFIYWNFLKCFWNDELGLETSIITNFDWYSPSNARRFTESEVRRLVEEHGLQILHFHTSEACYSGRFRRVRMADNGH